MYYILVLEIALCFTYFLISMDILLYISMYLLFISFLPDNTQITNKVNVLI